MADQPLPDDNKPLTPLGYMQESLSVWRDFSKRSAKIMMGQMGNFAARPSVKEDTDTAASELFRTMADMNLRHWQNTARLLDSMPAWMKTPNNMTGSAMVDWFDRIRRRSLAADPRPADRSRRPQDGVSEPGHAGGILRKRWQCVERRSCPHVLAPERSV